MKHIHSDFSIQRGHDQMLMSEISAAIPEIHDKGFVFSSTPGSVVKAFVLSLRIKLVERFDKTVIVE